MIKMQRDLHLGIEPLESRCMLATYFIDPVAGSDLQAVGSIDQPFKTISRATLFAQEGDTVALRKGICREQVELIRSGSAGNPLIFTAHDQEEVLITTTEPLSGWTQHSGDIYKASFDSNIFGRNNMTLFVDGQLMTEAHWSNLGGNVDVLNNSQWSTVQSGNLSTITDAALSNMADGLWNGAFVYVQTSDFTVEVRRILNFSSSSSSGTLTLENPLNRAPSAGDRYLIFDHLAALDAPGEWYFDESTNTVYLRAPAGGDLDNYTVEAKHRREAFDLNGHDYIHIRNIDFRGGDLDMEGSDHILLQGATIEMPDYGFGPEGSGGVRSLIIDGNYNVIRDNEFAGVHASTIFLEGSNNQIVNNYFHDIGYNNVNGAAVNLRPGSADNLISHNTIKRVGRAAISGTTLRAVIQHNDFSEVALTTSDVGAIYFANNSLGNSEIHHNIFHDISGHKVTGVYADNRTTDLIVHHNIMYEQSQWGAKINLPTSFILWYNNTIYNSGSIDAWAPAGSSESAVGSKFLNNIFSSVDPDLFDSPDKAEASNNLQSSSSSHYIKAAAGDFRLAGGSAAIDAGRIIPGITDKYQGPAPDIGALEFGEQMFAVGHDFANPPHPTYLWESVVFSNLAVNGDFESGLDGWTTEAGSPQQVFGNAWNYRGKGLAISGKYGLALGTGDRISQTFTDLEPNTTYIARANARVLGAEIQVENYDGKFGSTSTESVRSETGIASVGNGEWLRFDNVDFGTGSPLYNRVELGVTNTSAVDVEVRLDDPLTGTLLGTISVGSHGAPWFMEATGISAATGIHSLYLVFQGDAGNGVFDRIRLLDVETLEAVNLGAEGFDLQGTTESVSISGDYWKEATPAVEFTTGPSSTSAKVFLEKNSGNLMGYVDRFSIALSTNQPPLPIPGDFNGDKQVDSTDLPIWKNTYGEQDQTMGDADFDGDSDGFDFLAWQRNHGVSVAKTLIDVTIGNGSFENFTSGQGAPEQTNANRVANSFDNPNVTDTVVATIPGWTSSLERYLDGNSGNAFAGFDSVTTRASDGTRYAFANKRSCATLTSDPVTQHTTQIGDVFTLQFDSGSIDSGNAAFIVRIIFGSEVRHLNAFTETANGNGTIAAYTEDRIYQYTAVAEDAGEHPTVEFVINDGPSVTNVQWLIDNVRLKVDNFESAVQAVPIASLSPDVLPTNDTKMAVADVDEQRLIMALPSALFPQISLFDDTARSRSRQLQVDFAGQAEITASYKRKGNDSDSLSSPIVFVNAGQRTEEAPLRKTRGELRHAEWHATVDSFFAVLGHPLCRTDFNNP